MPFDPRLLASISTGVREEEAFRKKQEEERKKAEEAARVIAEIEQKKRKDAEDAQRKEEQERQEVARTDRHRRLKLLLEVTSREVCSAAINGSGDLRALVDSDVSQLYVREMRVLGFKVSRDTENYISHLRTLVSELEMMMEISRGYLDDFLAPYEAAVGCSISGLFQTIWTNAPVATTGCLNNEFERLKELSTSLGEAIPSNGSDTLVLFKDKIARASNNGQSLSTWTTGRSPDLSDVNSEAYRVQWTDIDWKSQPVSLPPNAFFAAWMISEKGRRLLGQIERRLTEAAFNGSTSLEFAFEALPSNPERWGHNEVHKICCTEGEPLGVFPSSPTILSRLFALLGFSHHVEMATERRGTIILGWDKGEQCPVSKPKIQKRKLKPNREYGPRTGTAAEVLKIARKFCEAFDRTLEPELDGEEIALVGGHRLEVVVLLHDGYDGVCYGSILASNNSGGLYGEVRLRGETLAVWADKFDGSDGSGVIPRSLVKTIREAVRLAFIRHLRFDPFEQETG